MDEQKIVGGQINFQQDSLEYKNSQIENLQASLASITGQLLNMQGILGEKEIEINDLRSKLSEVPMENESIRREDLPAGRQDHTLTLVGALINLYKFVFLPRKVE